MGRRRNQLPSTYDLFVIGEQLRIQLTKAGLIKDQRHLFRKHRQCFVAKELVDWVVRMHHVDSRQEAVRAMTYLHEFNVITHVLEEQGFKDKNILFRFTKDNDSYQTDRELLTFYRSLDIYNKLAQKGKDVIRNVYHQGDLYSRVFYGCDLIDFLLEWESDCSRDSLVEELKELLGRDIIRHITDDCHFKDDRIPYQFNIDFNKTCLLIDVLEIMENFTTFSTLRTTSAAATNDKGIEEEDLDASHDDNDSKFEEEEQEEKTMMTLMKGKGDKENKNTPLQQHEERLLQIQCDNVGFGLVLRGSSPCYVHSIDPLGPASKAGIKVGSVLTSVNGDPVSHLDHKKIGLMIASCDAMTLGIAKKTSSHHTQNRRAT